MAKRRSGLLAGVVIVLLLAAGAWVFRDRIMGRPGSEVATKVSPEAAEQAQAKLERLKAEGDTVHLTDVEFTSLIRYHLAGLTGPLRDPTVAFVDNTLQLSGRVPKDLIPSSPDIDRVRGFLPDTADVTLNGSLRTLRPGRAALDIGAVTVARVPVPASYYPVALQKMGRRDEAGLQPSEYPFALPPGVGSARVEGGELVLGAAPRP
jgi:hypothetical protein